jgi:FtsP/CotA-like multicopper oxidase with cupredoxin domain
MYCEPMFSFFSSALKVRRDTVSTGNSTAGDKVTFRFTTDNSGPWFLHW